VKILCHDLGCGKTPGIYRRWCAVLLVIALNACSNGLDEQNPTKESAAGGAPNATEGGASGGGSGSGTGTGGATPTLGSDPNDRDGDGLPADWEIKNGLNDNNPSDAYQDNDGDYLINLREYQLQLDPQNADSDGDQVPDGVEVDIHTDPAMAESQDVVTVCANACDFTLISAALASGKHYIRVKAGTYFDHFVVGNSRHVFSEAGAEKTVINADIDDHVVNLNSNASLHGFTISGGKALLGGGIYAAPTSVVIRRNIISNNTAIVSANDFNSGYGGGIYVASQGGGDYSVRIADNDIHHNTAVWGAGVDVSDYSNTALSANRIHDNIAEVPPALAGANGYQALGGGVFLSEYAYARCFNNVIYANQALDGKGGGIYAGFNNAVLNNTLVGNSAGVGSGVSSTSLLIGNIIWNNLPQQASVDAARVMHYSLVNGNYAGVGNVDADPLFVNSAINDFRLQKDSPAVDSGSRGVCNSDTLFSPCLLSADWDLLLGYGLALDKDIAGVARALDGDGKGAISADGSDYDIGAHEYIPPPQ